MKHCMLEQLNNNGLILVDKIENKVLQKSKMCFSKNMVNYDTIEKYLIPEIKKKIDKKLNWNVQFNTYRCSNGKHIVGASGFHRDQMDYTTFSILPPVYTVIVYLNKAKFEYLPGSHKIKPMNMIEMMKINRNIRQINLTPGDIIVMHGNVVHRAIKAFNHNVNRRVIQFFGTIPNQESADQWREHILLKFNPDRKHFQSQWVKLIAPIFNIIYSVQQMSMINIPSTRNYIDSSKRTKLVITYSMPIRKKKENDENLYVLLNQSNFNYY